MKPLRKNRASWKICIPVLEGSAARARRAIQEANPLADLIELRMDSLPPTPLEPLLRVAEKPVIVTNRREKEGGHYHGGERARLAVLQEAIDLGTEFVDLEVRSQRASLVGIRQGRANTRRVLSFHDFVGTPSPQALHNLLRRMMDGEAEVIKIATLARSWEDNLKVLALIPYARKRKQEIVAFCMGEKGKMSRIFAPLMGAAWTYACLDSKRASAAGQIPVAELRSLWESLS